MMNQMENHPLCSYPKLREFCEKNEIYYEGYSSLGSKHLALHERENIKKIAEAYKKSPAQILLKWNVQNKISIVPKSSNIERLKQNIDLFDFELS